MVKLNYYEIKLVWVYDVMMLVVKVVEEYGIMLVIENILDVDLVICCVMVDSFVLEVIVLLVDIGYVYLVCCMLDVLLVDYFLCDVGD